MFCLRQTSPSSDQDTSGLLGGFERRNSYTSIPVSEVSSGSRSHSHQEESDLHHHMRESIPPEEERLELLVSRLMMREKELKRRIEGLSNLWHNRLRPLELEKEKCVFRTQELGRAREMLKNQQHLEDAEPPPGPKCLRWADGAIYQVLCTVVIIVNLTTMFFQVINHSNSKDLYVLDQLFLGWYFLEITLKALLHQNQLLVGRLHVVWWNWMDLIIVVTGVIDQWMLPLLELTGLHAQNGHRPNIAALRALRLLRLFRLVRILKILRIFLESDLSWTEGNVFQSFIMAVIIFNSLIMGMELDYEWVGWAWIENVLLCIYLFELAVRLKRAGLDFFTHAEDQFWNNLDFFIVAGGVLQQWLIPVLTGLMAQMSGRTVQHSSSLATVMKMLRMLRLLRVARLARLLKGITPLYRLMVGVLQAFHCMFWVVILAIILLYAAALIFTDLVGHGEIYGDNPPEEAAMIFGSVPQSMFMLFKVMNDDQSVVDPLLKSNPVRVLFMIFMVVSNWSLLAILTSVISDNMITTSKKIETEDKELQERLREHELCERLRKLFEALDEDEGGDIDEEEFMTALQQDTFSGELQEVTGLLPRDLADLFVCLAEQSADGKRKIRYADFVGKLQDGDKDATERSVLRVEKKIRSLESSCDKRLQELTEALDLPVRLETTPVFDTSGH